MQAKLTLPAKTTTPNPSRPVLRLVLPGKPPLSEQYAALAEQWREIGAREDGHDALSRNISDNAAAKFAEYSALAAAAKEAGL